MKTWFAVAAFFLPPLIGAEPELPISKAASIAERALKELKVGAAYHIDSIGYVHGASRYEASIYPPLAQFSGSPNLITAISINDDGSYVFHSTPLGKPPKPDQRFPK